MTFMISKERAEEIQRAWMKHRNYDKKPDHHAFELQCFVEGMRAAAQEFLKMQKAANQPTLDDVQKMKPDLSDEGYPF